MGAASSPGSGGVVEVVVASAGGIPASVSRRATSFVPVTDRALGAKGQVSGPKTLRWSLRIPPSQRS